MKDRLLMFSQYAMPIFYIALAYLAGVIFEFIIIKWLKRRKLIGSSLINDSILRTSKGPVLFMFLIGGLYCAEMSIVTDQKTHGILQKAIGILAIFVGTIIISKICEFGISVYASKKQNLLTSTSIFVNIARVTIFTIGIMIILDFIGVSIAPILTAVGIGGAAVALALKDTLTNLFSGLNLIASRQIKLGDYVKIESGEEGYITDISWRDTVIQTSSDNFVIVPNQKLALSIITNYSSPEKHVPVSIQICVDNDCDLEKVENVTMKIAKEVMQDVEGASKKHQASVSFSSFSDFGICMTVIMRAEEYGKQFLIKHEFIKRIHVAYEKEGIEVAFPLNEAIKSRLSKK